MTRAALDLLPAYFPRTAYARLAERILSRPERRANPDSLLMLASDLRQEDRAVRRPGENTALTLCTRLNIRATCEASGVPYMPDGDGTLGWVHLPWWAAVTYGVLHEVFGAGEEAAIVLYALREEDAYREALALCRSAGYEASARYAETWLRENSHKPLAARSEA